MREVELTWTKVLKVVWLMLWRGMVGGFVFGAVSGVIIGFVGFFLGVSDHQRTLAIVMVVGVFTPIWWVAVTRMALRKRYRDFRIVLVESP